MSAQRKRECFHSLSVRLRQPEQSRLAQTIEQLVEPRNDVVRTGCVCYRCRRFRTCACGAGRAGQICAPLHIFSRYDADAFNEKIQQSGSRPLSNLTGGIHLHTIRATDEKTLERVIQGLKDKGFLLLEDN